MEPSGLASLDALSNELSNISLDDKKQLSKKKTSKPIYVGVEIEPDKIHTIFSDCETPELLQSDKTVKGEFHSTLEFKPKDITQHLPNGTQCNIKIDGYGISPDAIALKVMTIVTIDGIEVKHILKEGGIPHITVALADGINAADSYLAIRDGTYVKFEEPITLDGNIKYYYPEYKPKSKETK